MKILAFDTSTRQLCLAACDNDKVYGYDLELATRMSALLVPTIKRVVDGLGWELEEIDYFCAGIGPGSFTGVRVGLATAKALSWSLNKPVAGISSLDILAANADPRATRVVSVIDAKRGLVYAGVYRKTGERIKRAAPYLLIDPASLVRKIRRDIGAAAASSTVILGDGLSVFEKEHLSGLGGIKILDKDYWRLQGVRMIGLAREAISGRKTCGAFGLAPLYLYPKECQIRLDKKKIK